MLVLALENKMKVKQIVGENNIMPQVDPQTPQQPQEPQNPQEPAHQVAHGDVIMGEVDGQTPGQEIGTVVGQPNSQGEVTVKKQDGSTAMINQQLLQPGQQPNTFQMPTQAIAPGSKVVAGPVTQGAPAMENAELSAVLRIAGLK